MLSNPDFKEKQVVICFANNNQKINFQNDNLIIKNEEDEIVLQNSCHKIFALWIVGSTTLTSGIMERSKKFGFGIHLFSYGFKQYGVWNSPTEGNFLLRDRQYKADALPMARLIIENKIDNQLQQLKSIRVKNTMQKEAVTFLTKYRNDVLQKISIQEIMGAEGMASKIYFEAWFWDCNWQGRKPRAKRDPLNVLMDIGYTFLFNIIESMLHLYGFDVYKGVLHQTFYQRKSLVCDIVEPFRVIIDRQIRTSYNLGQVKQEDFSLVKGQYVLDFKKAKPYTKLLLTCILEHKEAMFIYTQNYYRWIMKNKPIEDFPQFKYIDS
jgi:CRISP-associated protein Cas1